MTAAGFIEAESDKAVYRVGLNRWTEGFEVEFSRWIRAHLDENFMVRFQIETDCGQAPTAMRLIFARIHSLPSLVVQGDSPASARVGHFSTTWAHLPTERRWGPENWQQALHKDLRFRAYLKAALNLITVRALTANTYPVRLVDAQQPGKLSPWIRPGLLATDERHARMILSVDPGTAIPIREIQSTLPRKVRQLLVTPFTLLHYPSLARRGLVAWRWPVFEQGQWRLVEPASMPGFSNEQYFLPDAPFSKAQRELAEVDADLYKLNQQAVPLMRVQFDSLNEPTRRFVDRSSSTMARLQDRRAVLLRTLRLYQDKRQTEYVGTFPELMMRLAQRRAPTDAEMQEYVQSHLPRLTERVKLVSAAQEILAKDINAFADMGSSLFHAYSTPDRDYFELYIHSRTMDALKDADTSGELVGSYVQALRDQELVIGPGKKIDLYVWYAALGRGWVASDPRASLQDRWGLSSFIPEKLKSLVSLRSKLAKLARAYQDNQLFIDLERGKGSSGKPAEYETVARDLLRQQQDIHQEIRWIEKIAGSVVLDR